MATIRDVARESGVSVATVSYVLNDGPRAVRAQTRERVLDVMRRLNYHPNAMARGLVRRRMHTLGVLLGQVAPTVISNAYASGVLQGVFSAAAELDYSILLYPKGWQDARRSAAPFRDRKTDGVLVIAPLNDSDMVPGLAALGLPLVVVSSTSGEAYGIPCVDVDNYTGGRLAGEHLAALGHTRIAHIGGPPNQSSTHGRYTGFRDALAGAGVPFRAAEYLRESQYHVEGGYAAARDLLTLPERPTAVFAGNDDIALGTLQAARDLGLRVPEDLSVMGFDDVAFAAMATPPLTTIQQPLTELGSDATHLLVNQLDEDTPAPHDHGKAALPPTHFKVPTLIVRGSTAAPPR